MNVIQANCRIRFTPGDAAFIAGALGSRTGSAEALYRLLGDEDTRDLVLDDELLFRAVIEQRGCVPISLHLYFYVLVRRALVRAGIGDRVVADYVAEVLTEFSRQESVSPRAPGGGQPMECFVEILSAIAGADERTGFALHAHLGNRSLFLTGLFPDRIRHQTERRAAPGLGYYEGLGRSGFRVASGHRLAREYHLAGVFDTLSERFDAARHALNDLGTRLLSLGDAGGEIDALLSRHLHPRRN